MSASTSSSAGSPRYSTTRVRLWHDERRVLVRLRVRGVVKRLRGKLDDDAKSPSYIFTEVGAGYRMAEAGEPEQGG